MDHGLPFARGSANVIREERGWPFLSQRRRILKEAIKTGVRDRHSSSRPVGLDPAEKSRRVGIVWVCCPV